MSLLRVVVVIVVVHDGGDGGGGGLYYCRVAWQSVLYVFCYYSLLIVWRLFFFSIFFFGLVCSVTVILQCRVFFFFLPVFKLP